MKNFILAMALTLIAVQPARADEATDGSTTTKSTTTTTKTTPAKDADANANYKSVDEIMSGTTSEPPNSQSRAKGPRGIDGKGAWNLSAGPTITLGLDSDNMLYGVSGGYTFNMSKGFGIMPFFDANFGTGDDSAQFLEAGLAGKLSMGTLGQQLSRGYVSADLAVSNARNSDSQNAETGVAGGLGFGYTIAQTARTNVDLLFRYALMFNEVDGSLPSMVTARLGIDF